MDRENIVCVSEKSDCVKWQYFSDLIILSGFSKVKESTTNAIFYVMNAHFFYSFSEKQLGISAAN